MSPKQEDRGVEPESEEIRLTGEDTDDAPGHVIDGIGAPAAIEDDMAGD